LKIPIILQARVGSTRLSGKVLKEILGKPMLFYIIERLKVPKNTFVILAIPETEGNDPLCKIAKQMEIECVRGSEEDVLGRFYKVSQKFPAQFYIRATADNPIVDFEAVDRLLNFILSNNVDYALEKRMPRGSAVEIFNKRTLELSYRLATKKYDREHVVPFMRENKRLFKSAYPLPPKELEHPELNVTVDTEDEFNFAKKIYEKYYIEGKPFILRKLIDRILEEAKSEKR